MRGAGWKSTKLHLALIALVLVTTVYALMGFPPGEFSQYCIALCTIVGTFGAANTASKFAKPSVSAG